MESTAENIMIGGTSPRGTTMFQWTQPDGQTVQVPGFVSPEGTVSIFLPSEYMSANIERQMEEPNLNISLEGSEMHDTPFEFGPPPVAMLEDSNLNFQTIHDDVSQSGLIYQNQNIEEVGRSEGLFLEETEYPMCITEEKTAKRGRKPKMLGVELPNTPGPYICENCDEKIISYEEFVNHKKNHLKQKKFQCDCCFESFNKVVNLKLHVALQHTAVLCCPECQKRFSRVAAFKSHLAFHEEDDHLSCSDCGEEFELNSQLEEHSQNVHGPNIGKSGSLSYTCALCLRTFTNSISLKNHKKEHDRFRADNDIFGRPRKKKRKSNTTSTKPFNSCCYCEKKFERPSQLKRHILVHTGEKPFECEICKCAFNQKGSLQSHMAKHNGYRPFECPYCGIAFSQRGNLVSHVNKTHKVNLNGDRHECPECPCVFNNLKALRCHLTRFHESVKHEPDEAKHMSTLIENSKEEGLDLDILEKALRGSGFAAGQVSSDDKNVPTLDVTQVQEDGSKVSYSFRIRKEGKVQWYLCSCCSKEFMDPAALVRHFEYYSQRKPFHCQICYKCYTTKPSLIAHIKTHMDLKKYQCHLCKIQFSTKKMHSLHLMKHERSETYPCVQCSTEFKSAQHLTAHLKTLKHKNKVRAILKVPPYVKIGKHGEYKFQVSREAVFLEQCHKASVTERPYHCEVCFARFRKICHLKQHAMIHTGAKPFKCNVCERAFAKYGVLKQHIQTHLGLRPFACKECKKTFSMRSSLKRHFVTRHTNEMPFMCPICSHMFKTSQQCKRHMFIHAKSNDVKAVGRVMKISEPNKSEPAHTSQLTLAPPLTLKEEEDEESAMDILNIPGTADDGNQSFFADATGTITLPSLSQESIQELEQTLNQQFFSSDVSAVDTLGTDGNLESPKELLLGVNMEVGDSVTDEVYGPNESLTAVTDIFQIVPDSDSAGNLCGYPVSMAEIESGEMASPESPEKSLKSEKRPVKKLTCDQCGWVTESERQLMRHMTNHFETSRPRIKRSKVPVIEFTAEETAEIATINLGATASESEKMLVAAAAEKVGKGTRRGKTRAYHRRNVRCEKCDRGFSRNSDLIRHERTHTGEKPFQCELCNRCFSVKSTMVCHMKTHSKRPTLTCHVCNAQFSARSSLKVHMRLHTGSRPFHCPFCQERFRTSGHLKNHLESHKTVSKPLRPWTSDDINNLANYINSGLPLSVPIDEKENVSSQESEPRLPNLTEIVNLPDDGVTQLLTDEFNEHLVQALEEPVTRAPAKRGRKPNPVPILYTCSTCDRSFSKQSLLTRHERVHNGERPFVCYLCSRGFNQKHVLNEHVDAYHGGERHYACPYCSFKSVQKGNLKTHIGRLHQFAYYCDKDKGSSRTNGVMRKDDAMKNDVVVDMSESLEDDDENLDLNITEVQNADLEQVMGELFPQVT